MKSNNAKNILILTWVFTFSLLTAPRVQAAPGDLDPSFANGGPVLSTDFGGNTIAVQSDGKIVAVGMFFSAGSAFQFSLTRYNRDGSLDATFGSGGRVITNIGSMGAGYATSVAIQPDGKIIAGGSNDVYGDFTVNFLLARYNTDGSLDTTFGLDGKVVTSFNHEAGLRSIAIQPDGKIVAVGTSGHGTDNGFTSVRYKTDGSPDPTFGIGGIVVTQVAGISRGANAAVVQPDGKIVVAGTVFGSAGAFGRFAMVRYQGGTELTVTNVEELYSAVNNPTNAGSQITIAPGTYMLSVNNPKGAARPNAGQLELQQNMSLLGVVGDRGEVVIDAMNLPTSSYDSAPPVTLTAAIRMGRGTNTIEWLTARNAVNGNANIGTDLASAATTIRVAHVASTNSRRGLDVRNFGPAQAGRVVNAEVIDNDFYNNRIAAGESLRIASQSGATGGIINATIALNRGYDNNLGLIVENNQSSNAVTTVFSNGDRFFENGLGALIGGGLSQGSNPANGNTVSFTAYGGTFENNNGFNAFDHGGLLIIAGENTSFQNGTSNNTVNVDLRWCRFGNNQVADLAAYGARSKPETVGTPGTGNTVNLYLRGITPKFRTQEFVDCLPASPGSMNSVILTGLR